jgi:hypothetical protein
VESVKWVTGIDFILKFVSLPLIVDSEFYAEDKNSYERSEGDRLQNKGTWR